MGSKVMRLNPNYLLKPFLLLKEVFEKSYFLTFVNLMFDGTIEHEKGFPCTFVQKFVQQKGEPG